MRKTLRLTIAVATCAIAATIFTTPQSHLAKAVPQSDNPTETSSTLVRLLRLGSSQQVTYDCFDDVHRRAQAGVPGRALCTLESR